VRFCYKGNKRLLLDNFLPDYIVNSPFMDVFLLAPLCLTLLALIFIVRTHRINSLNKENPFLQVGGLFSPRERSFYGLLCQASCGEKNRHCKSLVFGKKNMQEILFMQGKLNTPMQQNKLKKLEKINFDFVICKQSDLSVVAIIELEDSNNNDKKKIQRLNALAKKCRQVDVPYHQFSLQKRYSIETLIEQIFCKK
jgi:hypothetical protein